MTVTLSKYIGSDLIVGHLNGAAACKNRCIIPRFERARDELFDIAARPIRYMYM